MFILRLSVLENLKGSRRNSWARGLDRTIGLFKNSLGKVKKSVTCFNQRKVLFKYTTVFSFI